MSQYPTRPQFFAMRFIRLLAKTCAANEVGPDAAFLLTNIATLEDVKRYRAPVTFTNEQLMPICGFGSRKRLVTARDRAMEAGWLHYEPGRKHVPGRYWVTIPARYADLPDGSCDGLGVDGFRSDTEQKESVSVPIRATNRNGNGTQTGTATAHHSYPSPSPLPNTATAVAAANGKSSRKKKTKARTYSDEFERFWAVYWLKTNKADAARAFPDALERIIDDPSLPPDDEGGAVDWLVQRTRDYARLRDETTDRLHPATYLNKDRFLDELGSVAKSTRTIRFNDEDSL